MFQKSVEIKEDHVIKRDHPNLLIVEVEKTNRAFNISQNYDFFRVPRVLDFDQEKGVAVFERLMDIQGIREIIDSKQKIDFSIKDISRSIAITHKELTLPDDMRIPLPAEFRFSGNEVYLHGDFSCDNVCVNKKYIGIIDWQMTKMHEGKATYGTRYFDIAWFVNNLFSKRFYKYLLSGSVTSLAQSFVDTYFSFAGNEQYRSDFKLYLEGFYDTKFTIRRNTLSLKNRILLTPGHIFWETFIKNL